MFRLSLYFFFPCLGENVKPPVLRLNSHWSCRVPPEYESDRNRECTLCLRVHLCTIISPAQLASLNEICRRGRNRSGEHHHHLFLYPHLLSDDDDDDDDVLLADSGHGGKSQSD
ncbi:unnamed protein product, partial [Brenthis ino]